MHHIVQGWAIGGRMRPMHHIVQGWANGGRMPPAHEDNSSGLRRVSWIQLKRGPPTIIDYF